MKRITKYRRTLGLLAALLIFGFAVWSVGDRAAKNKVAIEKGCILLNNVIIKSSQVQADPNGPTAPLIRGILSVIPKKYVKQYVERTNNGEPTFIPLVDCKKVAEHPDDIHAEQLRRTAPVPPPRIKIPPNKR